MFCSNCGAKLEDGAKFCGNCGGKVNAKVAAEMAAAAEESKSVETPMAAEEPVVEATPIVEEAPEVVEEPVVEEAPEVVEEQPVVEEVPEVAEEPVVEEVPEVVEESVVEEVPEVVEEPVAEEVPEVVEEPVAEEVPEVVEEPVAEEVPVAVEEPVEEEAPEVVEEPVAVEEPTAEEAPEVAEEPAVNEDPNATEELTMTMAPVVPEVKENEENPKSGKKNEENPEGGKKKKKGTFLIVLLFAVILALGAAVVWFLFGNKKKVELDLAGIVSIEVEGYSGYATALVTIDEEALEDKYEDLIYKHTDLEMSEFIEEVELLEYEVTALTGLSNGDKVVLSWKSDVETAAEEYKVDIICADVEYVVSGLKEVESFDPFENMAVNFSGVSGIGSANVTIEGDSEYINYFEYTVSPQTDLSNGDEVVVTFDNTMKVTIATRHGVQLAATEKKYTVSGLTEYVSKDEQMTDAAIAPMLQAAEAYYLKEISGWAEEASVKNLECVGHFISLPENKSGSVHNVVGLIYKVSANLYKEGRSLDVEYYYPVLFKNVLLLDDGTFQFDENELSSTGDRFTKSFEPENEEDVNVPSGSWYYYGYETKEAMEDDYDEYSMSWESMTTAKYVEKDYTATANNELSENKETWKAAVKNADATAIVADATDALLETTAGWMDTASINSIKCVETGLFSGDIASEAFPQNAYAVVLEVNAKVEYEETVEDFPYYAVVLYENVSVAADGTLTADFEGRKIYDGTFKKMIGEEEIYDEWFSPAVNVWVFQGFETLDALHAGMAELRHNFVYYKGEFVTYSVATGSDMDVWSKADDSAALQAAEAAFLETVANWRESVTVNSVECVDTYVISGDVPTAEDSAKLAVLLKVNAEIAFADRAEDFDYYYMVRFDNAQVTEDGVVSVDEEMKKLTVNPFTKMLGDEEVPGAEGEEPLNVWSFDGYATVEEAEATILSFSEDDVNYTATKVPEAPVVAPVEELFDVELTVVGEEKIKVIAAIREVTDLGLAEAKNLTDTAPGMIKTGVTKAEAEEIKSALEAVGATVTLKSLAAEPETDADDGETYDVELTDVGIELVKVIKVVREVTGLGLAEAKDLVDAAPSIVLEGLTKKEAEEVKTLLEEVGATVTLK